MAQNEITTKNNHTSPSNKFDHAVIGTDLDGIITYWNKFAEKIYGWTSIEAIGKSALIIVPDEFKDEAKDLMKQLIKDHQAQTKEIELQRKDGSVFFATVTDSPVFSKSGKLSGAVGVSIDITQKKQSENMTAFLNDASRQLSMTLDYKDTLKKLASLTVPTLADWFVIETLDDNKHLQLLTLNHVNPEKVKWALELRKKQPVDMSSPTGVPNVIRTGKSELYPSITEEMLKQTVKDAKTLKLVRDIGFSSVMIVPLIARSKILGAITFVATTESGRHYSHIELELAEEFARRAGMAIENSDLFTKAQKEIQERKKTEGELLKLNTRINTILETTTDAYFSLDKQWRFLYMNKQAEKIMSIDNQTVIGKNIWDIFPDAKDDIFFKKYHEAMEQNKSVSFDVFYQSTNNWYEFHVNPSSEGLIVYFRDITERKKSEEQLLQLAVIVQSSTDAILSKDINGKILSWNKGAEKLYGYKADEIIGKNVSVLVSDEKQQELKEIMSNMRKGIPVNSLETIRVKKNGEHFDASVSVSPLKDKNGNILGASTIARDITPLKQLDRRRDEFISIASHELKTPLTSIKAYAQLMERYLEENEDKRGCEYLERMNSQVNRLSLLVDDLLDISRIQVGKLTFQEEVFDFDELVTNIIADIQPTTKIHNIIRKGNTHVQAYADKHRIAQVLINLLTNAIKYSPQPSDIIVTTTADKTNVTVSVKDSGIGIPSDKLDKVFERFYRVYGKKRESYPGLGLGLYISHQIMKRHHGKMWVESEEGKGATFYFSLPITLHSRFIDSKNSRI